MLVFVAESRHQNPLTTGDAEDTEEVPIFVATVMPCAHCG
jgi:hypothetical protein